MDKNPSEVVDFIDCFAEWGESLIQVHFSAIIQPGS